MDECPSGLRSTPRKRVRVTPSASSNLASSASRVSSDWLETLFCSRLCIFACVCFFSPVFVYKVAKYVNNLGKIARALHSEREDRSRARVCFYFAKKGEQMRER